jgi:hypothetical protein
MSDILKTVLEVGHPKNVCHMSKNNPKYQLTVLMTVLMTRITVTIMDISKISMSH